MTCRPTFCLGLAQLLLGLAGVIWLGVGCASPNVNPAQPRANTGYADFFADPDDGLYWDVQRLDDSTRLFKNAFSELSAAEGGFLRLALPPGHYQFRISFLNRVIAGPALVEVEVRDAQVTPVRVELVAAGKTTVESKRTSVGGTAYGRYGRRTRINSSESATYRVSASPQPSQPYRPKQQMSYAPNSAH